MATRTTPLTSASEPDPISAETRARWREENCRRNGDLTPREIAERCVAIRSEWNDREEMSRRGIAYEIIHQNKKHVYVPSNPMASCIPDRCYRRNGKPYAPRRAG